MPVDNDEGERRKEKMEQRRFTRCPTRVAARLVSDYGSVEGVVRNYGLGGCYVAHPDVRVLGTDQVGSLIVAGVPYPVRLVTATATGSHLAFIHGGVEALPDWPRLCHRCMPQCPYFLTDRA
jgi:hypothetical protein